MSLSLLRQGKAAGGAVLAGCLLVLASGCGLTRGQVNAIGKFSDATSRLGTIASKEFIQSRADIIDINREALALGSPTVKPDQLDQFFTLERVGLRVTASDALAAYGTLLKTLATSDQSGAIQAANNNFVESLKQVQGVSLTEAQTGAIGAVIQFLGEGITEAYRRRKIQEVMEHSGEAVRILVEVIQRDFDASQPHWQLGYDASLKRLDQAILQKSPTAGINSLPVGESAVLQRALALSREKDTRRKVATAEILDACSKLVAAQQEVRRALASSDFEMTDIDDLFARVKKLEAVLRILDKG